MSETLKFGNGKFAVKEGSALAYNDENGNFKPLPFTFDRSTSATRVNKEGLIEVVSNNEPRIDFKDNSKGALLLEPQSTNLITNSQDINASSWYKQNLTVNTDNTISPAATQTADKVLENNVDSSHLFYQEVAANGNDTYNFSVFVKKLNRRYVGIQGFYNNVRGSIAFYDLDEGILVYTNQFGSGYSINDAKIEEYSDGWYRLSANITSPDSIHYLGLCLADDNWGSGTAYTNTYQGDVTKGVYIWGAQVEQGSYPTSYIPTSGSIGTRIAESSSQTLPDGVIGQTEGVAYVEIDWKGNNEESIFSVLHDGTVNNRMDFGYSAVFNSFYFNVRTSGSGQGLMQYASPTIGKYKLAISYKNNDFALWVNGVKEAVDGSGSVPVTTQYNVGNYIGGDREHSIISSKLYNTRLTDQELIALTS